jgi:hypothetical protein
MILFGSAPIMPLFFIYLRHTEVSTAQGDKKPRWGVGWIYFFLILIEGVLVSRVHLYN